MPVSECDSNVRIICIGKNDYSKYCANKCPFLIKAQWSPKEGVKYHVIEVTCCAEGGHAHDPDIKRYETVCPKGLSWDHIKGEKFEFDPDMLLKKEDLLKLKPEPLIMSKSKVEARRRKKIKVTKKMRREYKVMVKGQGTL